jgi:peptidoglycan/xylan/chitin deacetylase (PgdA/CDA1 family)/LysM repeat protein
MRSRTWRLPGVVLAATLALTACSAPTSSPTPSAHSSPSVTGEISTGPSASEAGSPSVDPSPSASTESTLYTVVAGDTLFSIARRFGTAIGQLQAWNAVRYPGLAADPDTLQAGWVLVVAGEPGVTPMPTSSPTPRPSNTGLACRTGVRAASAPTATYRNIPNAGPEVALTLDMGGRLDPAVQIMHLLIANRVCVTLFPTGAMSQTAIGQQVLALVRAHPELFEVGNHTMHHCDLVRGGLGSPTTAPCAGGVPTASFIRKELTDAAAILKAGTGQDPVPYWRPPYGSVSSSVIAAAASVGYTKTMLWDIDTIDWMPISDGGPTAQQIANKVLANARNGSVVLMHIGGYETLDALRIMIPALRQRGFALTSISDLLDSR